MSATRATTSSQARRGPVQLRFNDCTRPETLRRFIEDEAKAVAEQTGCEVAAGAKPERHGVRPQAGQVHRSVAKRLESVTGRRPEFSTGGGTSDARFIQDSARGRAWPAQCHHARTVRVRRPRDIATLTDIYVALLDAFSRTRRYEQRAIGIFDSGMGVDRHARACTQAARRTLSLSGRLRRALPYGTKSAETVRRYALQAARIDGPQVKAWSWPATRRRFAAGAAGSAAPLPAIAVSNRARARRSSFRPKDPSP